MNEDPGQDEQVDDESAFEDPSYADITALLAGARVSDPLPAEVAARLDETLAELTADRRVPVEVVALASRRRRAPRLLAAAAAVVVLGGAAVGLTQVLGNRDDTRPDSASAADSAGTASQPEAQPAAPLPTRSPATEPKSLDGLALGYSTDELPAFTTSGFSDEAASFVTGTTPVTGRLDDRSGTLDNGNLAPPAPATATPPDAKGDLPRSTDAAGGGQAGGNAGTTRTQSLTGAGCTPPTDPGGTVTPIRFDGHLATLVVHPVVDGNQLVQAWSCDGSTVLATTVLAR